MTWPMLSSPSWWQKLTSSSRSVGVAASSSRTWSWYYLLMLYSTVQLGVTYRGQTDVAVPEYIELLQLAQTTQRCQLPG